MSHITKLRIYDLYNHISNYKESDYYKKTLEQNQYAPETEQINVDELCRFRINTFKDIKNNGLINPVEVILEDGKYYVCEGGGRASSCLFLKQKVKCTLVDKAHTGAYLNVDEIELVN